MARRARALLLNGEAVGSWILGNPKQETKIKDWVLVIFLNNHLVRPGNGVRSTYSLVKIHNSHNWCHTHKGGTPLISVRVKTILLRYLYIKIDLQTHKREVFIEIFWHPLSSIRSLETKPNFTKTWALPNQSNFYLTATEPASSQWPAIIVGTMMTISVRVNRNKIIFCV